MIAAAAAAPPATNGLPFNWFDMAVLVVLGFGLFRGRRNGMSKELLPLLQWLVMVTVCGLGYAMLAGMLAGLVPDKSSSCRLRIAKTMNTAIASARYATRQLHD